MTSIPINRSISRERAWYSGRWFEDGGTFLVKGDDAVYERRDKLPGDLPNPSDVLAEMEGCVDA